MTGRSGSEGVRYLTDFIENKNNFKNKLSLLQLDFSSAYDNLDKDYLFQTMDFLKFEPALIKSIINLLENLK